ncbi:MAG: hypothetical protein EOP51_04565 [Sphingobacteriales bacterium]|nr:MAG: hypothetical protein EOP51_04565 [Sphingobacteriales bacterium]
MKRLNILFIAIAILVAGCSTPKVATAQPQEPVKAAEIEGNYILAVILTATENKDGEVSFDVYSASKNTGKLKPTQQRDTGKDYTICFANSTQECLSTFHVKDPLVVALEHPGDEQASLGTHNYRKKKGYVNLRTNYTADMKYVLVKDTAGKTLFIISLKNIN